MAAASYYQLDSFPHSDPTDGSDLYSGQGFNNDFVHTSDSLKPDLHTVHSDSNTYNDHPQHLMSEIPNTSPLRPATNSWNAPPPTYPPTKPLVRSSHVAAPPPLKIRTPNSRLRQRKYQSLKRYLRIGKIVTKVITVLFSTVMFAIMLFMAIKYQATKNEIRGGRTAWPKQPKLWPTFMLLVGAGITLLLSLITLFSYCCAFTKARRSWKLTVVKYVIHIGAWLVISVLYRYEKSTHGMDNDLWGWSCSTQVTALQSEFNGVVNFSSLCSVQVGSSSLQEEEVCS